MQTANKPLGLRRAVNIVVRVRRLERSRNMKISRQLEALTDATFLDRATNPTVEGSTAAAMKAAGETIRGAGVSIADIVEAQKRRRNNRKVYSKNRNVVQ